MVRHFVASHPATPIDVLLSLLAEHVDEVLQNVSLSLHLLADPGLFDQVSYAAALALLSCPSTPPGVVARLARRSPLGFEGAMIPRVWECSHAAEVQESKLQEHWDHMVRAADSVEQEPPLAELLKRAMSAHEREREEARRHPAMPHAWRRFLQRLEWSPSPPLSAEERRFLLHAGPHGRTLVLQDTSTPIEKLVEERTTHDHPTIQLALALHPDTPPEILSQLATTHHPAIAGALLCHPSLPEADRLALMAHPPVLLMTLRLLLSAYFPEHFAPITFFYETCEP